MMDGGATSNTRKTGVAIRVVMPLRYVVLVWAVIVVAVVVVVVVVAHMEWTQRQKPSDGNFGRE